MGLGAACRILDEPFRWSLLGAAVAGAAWFLLVRLDVRLGQFALIGGPSMTLLAIPYRAVIVGIVSSIVASASWSTAISGLAALGVSFMLGHYDWGGPIPGNSIRFYLSAGVGATSIHLLLGVWSGILLWRVVSHIRRREAVK